MTDLPPFRTKTIEEFLPLVGKAVRADCDPAAVELELVSATPLRQHLAMERPPFLLIFRSNPQAVLTEGHYVLRAPGFGPDQVYIAPIMRPAAGPPGHYYQAVFN